MVALVWLSSHIARHFSSSFIVTREKEGGDSYPLWFGLELSSILISTAIASSSTTLVDLSKENVVVVDNVAQIEVSVFLQNSWDELITNRNLQGSSSPP